MASTDPSDSFTKAAERDGAPIRHLPERPHHLQLGEIRRTAPQFGEDSDTFPPPPKQRPDLPRGPGQQRG